MKRLILFVLFANLLNFGFSSVNNLSDKGRKEHSSFSTLFANDVCASGNMFVSSPVKPVGQVEVSYQTIVNGQIVEDRPSVIMRCSSDACSSWSDTEGLKLLPTVPKETNYVDYVTRATYQVAQLSANNLIHTETRFDDFPMLTETGETATLLGYVCKHAKTSLRSNSIDIWYTVDLGVKGTPAMAYGLPSGLVLKIVRNGNYELVATHVKPLKKREEMPILPSEVGEKLDAQLYRHKMTENLITTVQVFSNEQISFGNEIVNPKDTESSETFKFAEGTVVLKKVKLPVAADGTEIYAELWQHSAGDAYDRTGSVFMIPTDKKQSFLDGLRNGVKTMPAFNARNGHQYHGVVATDSFSPLIEIMRFFTPFGIGHFNDKVSVYGQQWADSAFYKQDVTDLLPVLQGECWVGVFIGNYDKGGHRVSLKLKYYPESMEVPDKPSKKYWVAPLFNTLNVMEMAGQEYGTMFDSDTLKVDFNVPPGVKNISVRYITTGHGGWEGGDEYNRKTNTVLLDGQMLFQYTPWRCDCATFRKFNPASGNFWNGITSSDGSRSGWCPGTATNPVYYRLADLLPGQHQVRVAIPMGKTEGSSFSSWNVSCVLIGEYK